jgi:hypothetical protein
MRYHSFVVVVAKAKGIVPSPTIADPTIATQGTPILSVSRPASGRLRSAPILKGATRRCSPL